MSDLANRIAVLSPEKRSLLELLRKEGEAQKGRAKADSTQQAKSGLQPRSEPFCLISDEDRAKLPDGIVDAYPLVRMQLGMLYHMELTPDDPSPAYHNVNSFHVRSPLNQELFRQAVQHVVARHPALRTSFDMNTYSEPMQLVHESAYFPVGVDDLRHLSNSEQEKALWTFIESENKRFFDLSRPPLLRFHIHRRTDESFQFTLTELHAIFDGWSLTSTLAEVFSVYSAVLNDEPLPRPQPPAVTYRDFVLLERRALESKECRQYWEDKLAGCSVTRLARLPKSYLENPTLIIPKLYFSIDPDVVESLREFARSAAVPLKSVLLAAHLKVMSRFSGQSDVLTGLVSHGRPHELGGAQLRGLFLNTIPFRFNMSGSTWIDLVQKVFEAEVESMPFQRYPLAEIQKKWGRQPLLETAFTYLHFHSVRQMFQSSKIECLETTNLDLSVTHFTLSVVFMLDVLSTSRLTLVLDYKDSELCEEQIEAIHQAYETILREIVCDPLARHDSQCLLTSQERRHLLYEWNRAKKEFSSIDCIHHLVEAQADLTPQSIAIVSDSVRITYQEVNGRANQLAHHLIERGLGPESLVAIYTDRSSDMLIGMLGVLKAGAAFVPIDPACPKERISFILQDTKAEVLLTQHSLLVSLPQHDGYVLTLDTGWKKVEQYSRDNPTTSVSADNPIYVIYTSGSTGIPKGVVVTHSNVTRLLDATEQWFGFNQDDVWTMFHSQAFDFSVWEIWGALSRGASVVVVPHIVSRSPEAFYELLIDEQVTVLNQTPSAFRQLMKAEEQMSASPQTDGGKGLKLRYVIFGGEALELRSLRGWIKRHGDEHPQLINMYGITETTVHVTYRRITEPDVEGANGSLIGEAIADLEVYLLDEQMQAVPIGVAGEMYVGGAGLARGYLGRAELTAERFVPNPYSRREGARLYRTGDQARYLPTGELEYLGRIDNQVKIRGYRIELGEIEAVISRCEGVRDAVAVVREDQGEEKRIVGYVVWKKGEQGSVSELKREMSQRLPDYMVPAVIVELDEMPLTTNGKTDRAKLKLMRIESKKKQVELKQEKTPIEEEVSLIWAEALGLEEVGREENFFEIGGHSLLATQVVSRVRESLKVAVNLRDMFERPTVMEMAAAVERARREGDQVEGKEIMRRKSGTEIPLSFAQQRLWFIDHLTPGNPAFNIPGAIRLTGELDVDALERSFNEVVRRHEALRATFQTVKGRPRQVITPTQALRFPVLDLSGLDELAREAEARRIADEEAVQPFNLAQGPLVRIRLLRLSAENHIVLFAIHHIVTDGWSMNVLLHEVATLYLAFSSGAASPLPELPIQYADYAAWQQEWLKGEVLENHLSYWRRRLSGDIPMLRLPTDRPRPPVQTYRGATQFLTIPTSLAESLRSIGQQERATLFVMLLAAFQTLLYKYTGQDDIIVGTDIANRNHVEIEPLIGFFTNHLLMRTDLSGNPTFRQLLGRVRKVALEAYAHQDLPFDRLVESLHLDRTLNHTPLFQVLFSFLDKRMDSVELPNLTLSRMQVDARMAKYDLALFVEETDQGLVASCNYNTDLFDDANITRMLGRFETLLGSISRDPDARLNKVEMLTEAEKMERSAKVRNHVAGNLEKFKNAVPKALNLPQGGYPNSSEKPEPFDNLH